MNLTQSDWHSEALGLSGFAGCTEHTGGTLFVFVMTLFFKWPFVFIRMTAIVLFLFFLFVKGHTELIKYDSKEKLC